MAWADQDEVTYDNRFGFCRLDFSQNYGVPNGWRVSTDLTLIIEDPT